MWFDALQRTLRTAFRERGVAVSHEHRERLERELMADYVRARHDERSRTARTLGVRWLAAAGGCAAIVAACALPVEYDVELGNRLGIIVDVDQARAIDIRALSEFIRERHADDTFIVALIEAGTMRLQVSMVADVNLDALWEDLRAEFPQLADARREDGVLEAEVSGTLGGQLARKVLHFEFDRRSVARARDEVVRELRARDIDGFARVEVEQEVDGRQRIEVRMERRLEGVDAGPMLWVEQERELETGEG